MKKIIFALGILLTSAAYAVVPAPVIPISHYPSLNRIHYQTQVETWVTTKTALVTVGVDASLNQQGMDNLQQQVNDSLKGLSSTVTWQMTNYERTQGASGLEQIHIEEQARLTSDQLNNLRTKTEALSKPGVKYTVIDIQFTPSVAEIQAAQNDLRNQLYAQIKQEIDRVDQTYGQTFYVHDIEFYNGDQPPVMPQGAMYKTMALAAMPGPVSAPQATMSQKLVLSADVTLAATISATE